MKAWRSKCDGFPDGIIAAETYGRAMMVSCQSFIDAGYARTFREAMKEIRVRRAPEFDAKVAKATRNGQWFWNGGL